MNKWQNIITDRLKNIYQNTISTKQINRLINLIDNHTQSSENNSERWSEQDVVLITYGDSIIVDKEMPLVSLKQFLNQFLKDKINTVHILPFFPYSSDDGFSIIDFKQVNPELGNWEHIQSIATDYRLMADLVINHMSSKNQWFINFLNGKGEGHDFVLAESPETNLSEVTRPRNTPLLTPYQTKQGIQHVWTTFSADQIDLNFANPEVLITMTEILLYYLKNGTKIIRLDAIAFLWKEIGTTCLHQPKTHQVVKFMRDMLNKVDKSAIILTETNVPNKENLSYFGNYYDEAHMVYQFSLPPLLLHALNTGNGNYLTQWALTIPDLPNECTFFNFTSSHDGIGVRPLEGLLPEKEKENLYADIKKAGGLISMKANTDGSNSPYELNITYFDALKLTHKGADQWHNQRFICSQVIMMTLKGVPAFYIHSLLASPNYVQGVEITGRARTINRERLNKDYLYSELNSDSNRSQVFNALTTIIGIRKKQKAFHPSAKQVIFDYNNKLFVVERKADINNELLSISNLTDQKITFSLNNEHKAYSFDLLADKILNNNYLEPYQTIWLTKQ